MLTLNTRQLRALSIVAPGTLAHSGYTTGGVPFFITTQDDTARSGIWGIASYSDGSIGFYTGAQQTSEQQPTIREYDELVAEHDDALREAAYMERIGA
jgi:hypothetical protein